MITLDEAFDEEGESKDWSMSSHLGENETDFDVVASKIPEYAELRDFILKRNVEWAEVLETVVSKAIDLGAGKLK